MFRGVNDIMYQSEASRNIEQNPQRRPAKPKVHKKFNRSSKKILNKIINLGPLDQPNFFLKLNQSFIQRDIQEDLRISLSSFLMALKGSDA